MDITTAIVLGLGMGLAFGFALEKSRVFEPGVIVGQMQLRNFIMLKIFLSAVITGLLVLAVLNGLGLTKLHPKGTFYAADIVGGGLLGIGIAIAGACPGTVFAQMGAGYRDAFATFLGGIAGAVVFGYLEPALRPFLVAADAGKLTFDKVFGMPYWQAAVAFAALLIAFVYGVERWRNWRADLGRNFDGLGDVAGAMPGLGRDAPQGLAAGQHRAA